MRIIAGALRGRPLVAPKGHSTRPTADRARQALFDVLEHAAWSSGVGGARVIDLFAGSGALGLEALSRGAAFCLLIDSAKAAVEVITQNARSLDLADRTRIERRDAASLGPRSAGEPFDLAFLDPPYGQNLAWVALRSLVAGDWLSQGAVAAVETGAGELPLAADGFAVLEARTWGAARIWFLEKTDKAA